MMYNLWDTEIGKYLGQFEDQDAMLSVIRTLLDRYGSDYADSLSVGRIQTNGDVLPAITGDDLLQMVGVGTARREASSGPAGGRVIRSSKTKINSRDTGTWAATPSQKSDRLK